MILMFFFKSKIGPAFSFFLVEITDFNSPAGRARPLVLESGPEMVREMHGARGFLV